MKKSIRKQTWLLLFTLIAVVAALVAAPGLALAHGEAIQVDPLQAQPGEAVTVTGTGWEAGSTIRVSLEGTRGIVPLDTVMADAKGSFTMKMAIPEGVSAGSYRMVARSGDESAAMDFTVMEMAGMTGSSEQSQAAESLVVVQRSATETVAVGIIVAALVGAGAFLVFMGTERRPSLQR